MSEIDAAKISREPEIDGTNPYLLAETVWAARHGSYSALALQAKILTAVGLLALAGAVWAFLEVGSRQNFMPFLVATDQLLPQKAIDGVSVARLPDGVVRRELATFIERLRSIPTDRAVLRRDIARLFSFLATNTPGERKVREFMEDRTLTPGQFVGTLTRRVDVSSVVFKGGDSWVVEWRETAQRVENGATPVAGLFQATLVVGEAEAQDADALAVNPFGLFIRDYTISYLGAE